MYTIKLRRDGVEIDGKVYKIGDVLRATNEKGEIVHEGVVRGICRLLSLGVHSRGSRVPGCEIYTNRLRGGRMED